MRRGFVPTEVKNLVQVCGRDVLVPRATGSLAAPANMAAPGQASVRMHLVANP